MDAHGSFSPVATLGIGDLDCDSLETSLDGARLFAGGRDGKVRVFAVDAIEDEARPGAHPDCLLTCVAAASKRVAATRATDGSARVWDLQAARLVTAIDSQLVANGGPMAFSPDGATFVMAGEEEIEVWDVREARRVRTLRPTEELGRFGAFSLAVSSDAAKVVAGARGNGLALWDASGATPPKRFEGRTEQVSDIVLSPDGARAVTIAYFAPPDAKPFDFRAARQVLQGWDLATLKLLWTQPFEKPAGALGGPDPRFACFLADGGRVATLSKDADDAVAIWDAATGEIVRTIPLEMDFDAEQLAGDGTLCVAGARDGVFTLRWIDLDAARVVREATLKEGWRCALLPGASEALVLEKNEVRWTDLTTGAVRARFALDWEPSRCIVSADGAIALVTDQMGRVHLFRITGA
jgi:WD40 repeat protein